MHRVAALTRGRLTPSARFRVRQNIPKLKDLGFEVTEYYSRIDASASVPLPLEGWPRSLRFPFVAAWKSLKLTSRIPDIYRANQHDIVWLQRELLSAHATIEWMLKKNMVFDVDDAIWLSRPKFAESLSKKIVPRANLIIAGNEYLADWFSSFNKNIVIIPTAVDVEKFCPIKNKVPERFVIGWIGTSSNLPHVKMIAPALQQFLEKYDDAEFLLVSDKQPVLNGLKSFRYLRWSESNEAEVIGEMDVGIMPLADNEHTCGKCSFKMLQYMSCGLPVVVSPVGMNKFVLSLGDIGLSAITIDDWVDALDFFYHNRALAQKMGTTGRDLVEAEFSTEVVSRKIAKAFHSLL